MPLCCTFRCGSSLITSSRRRCAEQRLIKIRTIAVRKAAWIIALLRYFFPVALTPPHAIPGKLLGTMAYKSGGWNAQWLTSCAARHMTDWLHVALPFALDVEVRKASWRTTKWGVYYAFNMLRQLRVGQLRTKDQSQSANVKWDI